MYSKMAITLSYGTTAAGHVLSFMHACTLYIHVCILEFLSHVKLRSARAEQGTYSSIVARDSEKERAPKQLDEEKVYITKTTPLTLILALVTVTAQQTPDLLF